MTTSNIYKEWVAGVFDRASDSYDHIGPKTFTYFGKGLVEFSKIRSGAQILDVACGRGAVLIPASAAVGEAGTVIGIDISNGMVKRLEKDLEQKGISNAKVIQMDAEDLKFQDARFDYLLCGLALFFFPDLKCALQEFFRVLSSQGRLAVSTIERLEVPWEDRLLKTRKSYQDRVTPVPAMKIKDLNEEKEVTDALEEVGFADIEHQIDSQRFFFRDEKEWWETQWSLFGRAFMECLDPDSLREYQHEVLDIVREYKSSKGIPLTVIVRYSKAKKPADCEDE